jgi:TonB family protein
MFQSNPETKLAQSQNGFGKNKQNRQLRIALALLIVALVALFVRDHDFWFSSDSTESDSTAAVSAPAATPAPTANAKAASQTATATAPTAPKTSTLAAVTKRNEPAKAVAPEKTKTAKRVTIAPLQVEVISSAKHAPAHTTAPKAQVRSDVQKNPDSVTTVSSITNAAERESLSSDSAPVLHQAADATYPLLGPRMKVQGSVVLQAVIGSDGIIQNLKVVSGPSILTAAAQQAVRQWHFKPYLQNGEAVETKATITVNFSIRISDNPAAAS